MAAEIGNDYWTRRSVHGKPKKYSPEELWDNAVKYFEWASSTPLKQQVVHGKDSNIVELEKPRAFSEMALCIFLDMTTETFRNYLTNTEAYKDYFEVSMRIREIIYTQKFEGAAAELLSPNIIARDLGLKESTVVDANIKTFGKLESE